MMNRNHMAFEISFLYANFCHNNDKHVLNNESLGQFFFSFAIEFEVPQTKLHVSLVAEEKEIQMKCR